MPKSLASPHTGYITSLAFSSEEGEQAILAIGRVDGRLALWDTVGKRPLFDTTHSFPISCVSFAPSRINRNSFRDESIVSKLEMLAVGDEAGQVHIYAVEMPDEVQRDLYDWHGAMNVIARFEVHSQQICGIAWSLRSQYMATGGNDNCVQIFDMKNLLSDKCYHMRGLPAPMTTPIIKTTSAKHVFKLDAAVKAIAFAPFSSSLVALGAGSNDRAIHFFNIVTGKQVAMIDCYAQITSLV